MDPTPTSITVFFKKNGTITVEGTVIVLDEDGNVMTQPETMRPPTLTHS